MTQPRRKPKWRVDPNPQHHTEDTISDGQSDRAKVVVWNDPELAEKIAGWMNRVAVEKARNCASCGTALSDYCPHCNHLWQT